MCASWIGKKKKKKLMNYTMASSGLLTVAHDSFMRNSEHAGPGQIIIDWQSGHSIPFQRRSYRDYNIKCNIKHNRVLFCIWFFFDGLNHPKENVHSLNGQAKHWEGFQENHKQCTFKKIRTIKEKSIWKDGNVISVT